MKNVSLFLTALLACAGAGLWAAPGKKADSAHLYFENYENPATHKVINTFAEVGPGFGFNGSAGLRLTSKKDNKKFKYYLPIKFKPQVGKRYIYTIYYRCQGKGFTHIFWEAYKNARHLFGNWNTKRTKLEGGWEKCEMAIFCKNNIDVSGKDCVLRFGLYVTPLGPKGEIVKFDYDNISIKEDKPVWHLNTVWPTHNTIQNEHGRMRLFTAFDGSFLKKGSDPIYLIDLLDKNGKRLARRAVKDNKGVIRLSFGRIAYTGEGTLRGTYYDRKYKKTLAVKNIPVTIARTYKPKKGEIIIDEKGRAIMDGKPWMPLGFFASFGRNRSYAHAEKEMKWLKEAGYNALIEYWVDAWKGERQKKFFDLMHKNGLRLFYNLTSVVHHRDKIHTVYRDKALRAMKHPVLAGWYVMDEAHEDQYASIVALRRMLNKMTPGKVCWSYNIFEVAPFLGAADMPGAGIYPIGSAVDLTAADAKLRKAKAVTSGLWFAPQSMNWIHYNKEYRRIKDPKKAQEFYRKNGKEPTENEYLSVPLLQASHGVTGFFFYAYHDLITCPIPGWVEKRKAAFVNIARVLRGLEPYILSGEKIEEIPHKDVKGKTRIAALSNGKGKYAILIIGLTKDNVATFTLPAKYGKLKAHTLLTSGKGNTYTFKGKAFSCDYMK